MVVDTYQNRQADRIEDDSIGRCTLKIERPIITAKSAAKILSLCFGEFFGANELNTTNSFHRFFWNVVLSISKQKKKEIR